MAIYNEIRGYIGTTGSGKSYAMAAHLLEKMRDDPTRRTVLIDHKRGTTGFGEYADLPLFYMIVDQDVHALLHSSLWEEILDRYPRLRIQQPNEEIQRLATGGRSAKIDLWFIIQRPALFDTTVFSQLHLAYIFRLSDINDLKRISSICQGIPLSEISALKRTEYFFFDLVHGNHEKRIQKEISGFIHYG